MALASPSRFCCCSARWAALDATREPATARAMLRRLATTSVTRPDPPGWSQALFAAHPTIIDRIAMTYAWEARAESAAAP
ncbi:MAG: hypothetical protein WD404_05080 [Solirubrobacterales bacterium]